MKRRTKIATGALATFAIILALSQSPGCKTFDQSRADQASAYVEEQIADDDAIIKSETATAIEKGEASARKAERLKEKQALAAAVAQHQQDLAHPPGAAAQAVATGVADAVPIYGGTIAGLIGVGFGVYRRMREHKQAKVVDQILAGIDNAKTNPKNPAGTMLADALKASEPFIHAAQDLLTVRTVDDKLKELKAEKA